MAIADTFWPFVVTIWCTAMAVVTCTGQNSSFGLTSEIGPRDLARLICESRLHSASQRTDGSPSTGVCLPSWTRIGGDGRDSLDFNQNHDNMQQRCLQHRASQLLCSTAEEGQCSALDLKAPKLCLEGAAQLLKDTADADDVSSYPPVHGGDEASAPSSSITILDDLKQRLCQNVLLSDCDACADAFDASATGSSFPSQGTSSGCRRCAECGRWLTWANASAADASATSSSSIHETERNDVAGQHQPLWTHFLKACLEALPTSWAWEELGRSWLCLPRSSASFRCLEEGGQDNRRCAGLTEHGTNGLSQLCDFRTTCEAPGSRNEATAKRTIRSGPTGNAMDGASSSEVQNMQHMPMTCSEEAEQLNAKSGLPCQSEEDCLVSDEGPDFLSGNTDEASSAKICQTDPHCVIYSCTSITNDDSKESNLTATPSQEVLTISGPCGRRCIPSEAQVVSAALANGGRYLVLRLNTAATPFRGPCWDIFDNDTATMTAQEQLGTKAACEALGNELRVRLGPFAQVSAGSRLRLSPLAKLWSASNGSRFVGSVTVDGGSQTSLTAAVENGPSGLAYTAGGLRLTGSLRGPTSVYVGCDNSLPILLDATSVSDSAAIRPVTRVQWSASRAPSPAELVALQAALDSAEAAQQRQPAMLLEVSTSGLSPGVYSVTIAAELGAASGNLTGWGTLNSTHTFQLQGSLPGPLAYIPGGSRQGFDTEEGVWLPAFVMKPGPDCPEASAELAYGWRDISEGVRTSVQKSLLGLGANNTARSDDAAQLKDLQIAGPVDIPVLQERHLVLKVWQQSTMGAGEAGVPAVEAEVTLVAQPSPLAVSLDGPTGRVAANEDLVLTGHWTRGPCVMANAVVNLRLVCRTLPSLLPCAPSAPEVAPGPGNHSIQWGDTLGDSNEGSFFVAKGSGQGIVPAALLQAGSEYRVCLQAEVADNSSNESNFTGIRNATSLHVAPTETDTPTGPVLRAAQSCIRIRAVEGLPAVKGFIRRSCPNDLSGEICSLPHPISEDLWLELSVSANDQTQHVALESVTWWSINSINLNYQSVIGSSDNPGVFLKVTAAELQEHASVSEMLISANVTFQDSSRPPSTYSISIELDWGPVCLSVARLPCLQTYFSPGNRGIAAVASGWVSSSRAPEGPHGLFISDGTPDQGSGIPSSIPDQLSDDLIYEFGEVLPISGAYLPHERRKRFPYHTFSSGFSFMHSGGGHRIYVCVSGGSRQITSCEEIGIGAGEWTLEMQSGPSTTERQGRALKGFEHITKLAEAATSGAPDGGRARKPVSLPGLLKDLQWVSGASEAESTDEAIEEARQAAFLAIMQGLISNSTLQFISGEAKIAAVQEISWFLSTQRLNLTCEQLSHSVGGALLETSGQSSMYDDGSGQRSSVPACRLDWIVADANALQAFATSAICLNCHSANTTPALLMSNLDVESLDPDKANLPGNQILSVINRMSEGLGNSMRACHQASLSKSMAVPSTYEAPSTQQVDIAHKEGTLSMILESSDGLIAMAASVVDDGNKGPNMDLEKGNASTINYSPSVYALGKCSGMRAAHVAVNSSISPDLQSWQQDGIQDNVRQRIPDDDALGSWSALSIQLDPAIAAECSIKEDEMDDGTPSLPGASVSCELSLVYSGSAGIVFLESFGGEILDLTANLPLSYPVSPLSGLAQVYLSPALRQAFLDSLPQARHAMELRFSTVHQEEHAAYPAISNLRCLQIDSRADPVRYELIPVTRSPEDNATIVCIIKTMPDEEPPSFMLVMVENMDTDAAEEAQPTSGAGQAPPSPVQGATMASADDHYRHPDKGDATFHATWLRMDGIWTQWPLWRKLVIVCICLLVALCSAGAVAALSCCCSQMSSRGRASHRYRERIRRDRQASHRLSSKPYLLRVQATPTQQSHPSSASVV